MTKFAKRFLSAAAAACLLCGCILPASAAEAEEEPRVLQYETAQPVSSVVVDTEYADVVIQPGQTDRITVESAADAKGEYSYDCSVTEGVLTVNVEGIKGEEFRDYIQIGPFRFLNQYGSILRNTITVTLPNKMYDSVRTNTSWGDLRMGNIQSQTAEMACDWGDIILTGTQPQFLDLQAEWGDIIFDQAAVTQCEGTTKYGDVTGTIAGSQSSYSTSTAVEYGDSNLRAQIGDGVHALAFNTKYGDIDVDFTA
ncbi:MAG TPA: DUF4097 domain-containing protein [Candidatus Faecalibacterium gallistercoris]|uniref:DUF4097 domain-containing protein n=1 Tax=Candidatus Faecalibacterium gallistercoris TaxID=2838579 RepID=A0A9D2JN31_9FIRM|nr:DUF4097 domain-containing protein [Candidatus Faecalibacterium gallistercoris]